MSPFTTVNLHRERKDKNAQIVNVLIEYLTSMMTCAQAVEIPLSSLTNLFRTTLTQMNIFNLLS